MKVFHRSLFPALLVVVLACLVPGRMSGEIHRLVERTKLEGFGDLTFFLRMPEGVGPMEGRSGRGSPVRGVLAICTWSEKPEQVRPNVEWGGSFGRFLELADEYGLAVVTWTNFKGYQMGVSGDEMERDALKAYEKAYNDRAREWRHGFRRLCRKHGLPERNVLMFGLSGGGQMAHRLALRMPEYFFAVHIHVNSSYDVLKRDGNQVLWLVTTGTREYGYPAAVRFYRNALEAGYHMIFRAEENLGHRMSPATWETSLAFFEYCLKFLPDARDPQWRRPPVDRFYLMRQPAYIGDYVNGEAFAREVAAKHMDASLMVALPTKEIAEAWGTVLDFE